MFQQSFSAARRLTVKQNRNEMTLIMFVPFVILVGLASSAPTFSLSLAYVALSPIPENIYNQVQDTKSGEYAFGYAGGPVAREEARTSDGVTRGAYSYVDAHGIVQYYRYIADDDGFRVVGTNIPTDGTSRPQLELETAKIEPVDAEELTEKTFEPASSRKKRSTIYSEVPVAKALLTTPLTVVEASSVPTATSSQSRLQFHNSLKTEIQQPIEAFPAKTVAAVPATPVEVRSVEAIPAAIATSVPTATSSQSRFQIHESLKTEIHDPIETIPAETVKAVPATPIAVKSIEAIPVAVAASVPIATSSQSRFQIHKSLKTEIHDPIEAIPVKTVAEVSAAPVAIPVSTRSIEAFPVAVAASVPIATSSQSRFQIHKSLKTEIHDPIEAIPVETVAEVSAAPVAIPVSTKSIEAIPVVGVASIPIATSSQSRFQIHKSLKTEIHDPIETIAVEKIAAVPTVPATVSVSTKNSEAIPVAIAASVSTSTSSRSDSQTHESLKTIQSDMSDPLVVQPIATVPASPSAVTAVPPAAKAIPADSSLKTEIHVPQVSIPVAVESEIVHNTPVVAEISADARTIATIPAVVPTPIATSTSNQRRFQVHNGETVEFEALPQFLGYKVVNLQPVISLQPANSFSHPSLARNQVGVGLGVLPSPIFAYHNYEACSFC